MSTLADGSSKLKTDPIFEALGTIDEANSAIGLVLAVTSDQSLVPILTIVQDDLISLGSQLASGTATISQTDVEKLQDWSDQVSADLPELTSFIRPGGKLAAAHLHLARTIVRRAERAVWRVQPAGPVLSYLNRLSDLLFVLARAIKD